MPARLTRQRSRSLTLLVKSFFTGTVRSRGEDYMLNQRVRIHQWSATAIVAVARGTADYRVMLTRTTPRSAVVQMSCTCPYYQGTGPCKHLWAFARIVECDSRWDASWNTPNLDVDVDSAATDILDEDDDVEDDFGDDFDDGDDDDDDGSSVRKQERLRAFDRAAISQRMQKYWAARRKPAKLKSARPKPAKLKSARPKPAKPKSDPDDQAANQALQRLDSIQPLLQTEALARRQRAAATRDAAPYSERVFIIDGPAARQSRHLLIHMARRTRLGPDEWSAPEPIAVTALDLPTIDDIEERELLALLLGGSTHSTPYGFYGSPPASTIFGAVSTPLLVPDQFHSVLVPRLCATRRCYLLDDARAGTYRLLRWESRPWTISLDIAPDHQPGSTGYLLTGRLSRNPDVHDADDPTPRSALLSIVAETASPATTGAAPIVDTIPAAAPSIVLASGLVFNDDEVSLMTGAGSAWLSDLRTRGPIRFPGSHVNRLLGTLLDLPAAPPVSVPDELRFETRRPQPGPVLSLRPSHYADGRFHANLAFDYDHVRISRSDERAAVYEPDSRTLILRDADAESRSELALEANQLRVQHECPSGVLRIDVSRKRVPALVRDLAPLGWRIEVEGKTYRVARDTTVDVQSGIDWFDIGGMVNFDGVSMALPELLAAVKRGESTVVLADGSIGVVPDDWKAQYGALAAFAHAEHGGSLRVHTAQLCLVDALLATRPSVSWDAQSQQLRDRLRGFQGIVPADAPPTFAGVLRGYQREGLAWLRFLSELGLGGCLADDMGLGKTIMVLALLDSQREGGPSLVVVPRSVLFNWRTEAARFTPQLRVLDYSGTDRRACDNDQLAQAHLVLTTYGTLRRDAARLADFPFNYVILDESQAIKNAATVSAKAVRLLNARHRLALSGTPIENHVGELWSLFEFLNPGLLGSAQRGIVSRARAGDVGALDTLRQGLRPYILRRTKAQVAPELPPRSEDTIVCELDASERKRYEELRDHYRASILGLVDRQGVARSRFHVLEALLRLRQAACHPGLLDPRRHHDSSAKVEALVERLVEVVAEGHKALVFSQFTSFLALVQPVLQYRGIVYEYLDGKTRDRDARVHRFQTDPSCGAFLISLKAGGLGLNLTAAEYVFLLDPWWNPAVEAQAIDRAHRIGQDRPVFAYRLVVKDTVEERILELQARKRAVADAIITADNSALGDLTRQDLELLLS